MNILLIGHSIVDNIEVAGQNEIRPGGIYYSLNGMLASKNDNDKIFLLTGLNNKYEDLFKIYAQADVSLSSEIKNMPEVILKITDNTERGEIYKNISTHLDLTKINEWKLFDGILINMITGFDLSLEQLIKIRKSFDKDIYFDIHTLSRGMDGNMNRLFRKIPLVEKWLENIDVLQCNENELKTIFDEEEEEAANRILNLGPKILLITMGNKGAVAYYFSGRNLIRHFVKSEKVKVANKIGCGDIFGAVFFYSYLSGVNIEHSLILANNAAGFSVASRFPVDLNGLKQKIYKAL